MNFAVVGFCCGAAVLGLAGTAFAVTPGQLQARLDAGEKITLIDLRSKAAYQTGHIPNAIHVPAVLVPQKSLPPLGAVVAYDDGVGVDTTSDAVTALNGKAGIKAEALEGGFAAWETAHADASTRGRGVQPEELPMITYDHLKTAQSADVVLVDLRTSGQPSVQKAAAKATTAQPLTDLAAEFPKARVVTSPFESGGGIRKLAMKGGSQPQPLLVLIDNGDGSAQATARTLKANGVKRFAILVGGEEMIARKGLSGSDRIGSSIVVRRPNTAGATNSN
jgi:rhodanese-related sulfurtransferase